MRILKAGAAYFGLVFGAGFLFGCVRVPFLAPRLGVRTAELLEMPFMFAVIVLAARFVVRRWALPAVAPVRLGMGFTALAMLVTAEMLFAVWVRGLSLGAYVAGRDPVSGGVFLVMLGVMALMPLGVERG